MSCRLDQLGVNIANTVSRDIPADNMISDALITLNYLVNLSMEKILIKSIKFKDWMDLFVTNWERSLDHHPKHSLVRDPAYQRHLLPGGGECDGEDVLVESTMLTLFYLVLTIVMVMRMIMWLSLIHI